MTENTAGVAKAANGLCIFNRIVQPHGSGDDPPGVQEIEIDLCRHTGRQAQHLPSVGDWKQTPACSHEAGLAAVMTRPWVTAAGMRSEVTVRMRCSCQNCFLFDFIVQGEKHCYRTGLKTKQNGNHIQRPQWLARRKAAKYKPLRHLSNTTRVGNNLGFKLEDDWQHFCFVLFNSAASSGLDFINQPTKFELLKKICHIPACWLWHLIRSVAAARQDYKTMRGLTEETKILWLH